MDNGNVTLYHPTGARCNLALPADPSEAFEAVNAYLKAGFMVNAPTGDGVKTVNIDFAIRCKFEHNGKKGERLYLYDLSSQFASSAMTVYLDTDEAIAAFERAAGYTVASMPFVTGKAVPTSDSGEYFEKYARPFKVTVKRQKVDITEEKPEGRWQLVAYVGANGSELKQQPATGNGNSDPVNYEAEAMNWFASNGIAFADVKALLMLTDGTTPKPSDKDGWAKVMRQYVATVKAKAS